MKNKPIDEVLGELPFFAGFSREQLAYIAGCARHVVFQPESYLFKAGDPADEWYLIREGRVAMEVLLAERGARTIQTLHDGDVVGFSWIVRPYRWVFDARAVDTVRTTAFDGRCLRVKCEEDPALGYRLMQRFSEVMLARLQATRLQLLDVYGDGGR